VQGEKSAKKRGFINGGSRGGFRRDPSVGRTALSKEEIERRPENKGSGNRGITSPRRKKKTGGSGLEGLGWGVHSRDFNAEREKKKRRKREVCIVRAIAKGNFKTLKDLGYAPRLGSGSCEGGPGTGNDALTFREPSKWEEPDRGGLRDSPLNTTGTKLTNLGRDRKGEGPGARKLRFFIESSKGEGKQYWQLRTGEGRQVSNGQKGVLEENNKNLTGLRSLKGKLETN